jgi:hypothetical protein
MRQLQFLFQEPGLLEAVALDPALPKPQDGLNTPGYRSLWVADLMVDYDPRTGQPYTFMSSSFDKTYPLVIWALKLHMADEKFDLPQAGLRAVPLHEAFSWAYAHFILEDQPPLHRPQNGTESPSLTNQVLQYAAATAS